MKSNNVNQKEKEPNMSYHFFCLSCISIILIFPLRRQWKSHVHTLYYAMRAVNTHKTKQIVISVLCEVYFFALLCFALCAMSMHDTFWSSRHQPCVIMHRTETEFGMLISFSGLNKLLALLEVVAAVATHYIYCGFRLNIFHSFSRCFRFRLSFKM